MAPGIPAESVQNMVVLPYDDAESLEWVRANAGDLAAVVCETVQSRHPGLRPREFLAELRSITEASGSALVFDEVVTGFRVHPGGMQRVFGIRADMATYGKVVGGGMPVGVLAGNRRFMDALDGGMWSYGDKSFPRWRRRSCRHLRAPSAGVGGAEGGAALSEGTRAGAAGPAYRAHRRPGGRAERGVRRAWPAYPCGNLR